MDSAFELLERPSVQRVEGFRFAHARVRGPYEPWKRVSTLDMVAETLEAAGIDRTGPAFGVYHDLPDGRASPNDWEADLGWPVADGVTLPRGPVRVVNVPALDAVGLRYRGDLTSFPAAFQFLLEWADRGEVAPAGPLLERFHVSDALTNTEERDVWVALAPLAFQGAQSKAHSSTAGAGLDASKRTR